MIMKRIGTTVASMVISFSLLGAWFPTTASAALRTNHPVSIPQGWKTYTYRLLRISVPSDWAVEHVNNTCPVRSAPGTLNLSGSKISLCYTGTGNANSVTLLSLPADNEYMSLCPTISVNGLAAKVGPCGGSNAAGIVVYWIPALGVQAVGTGTDNENVTGPGTGTVVGRILHTLRR